MKKELEKHDEQMADMVSRRKFLQKAGRYSVIAAVALSSPSILLQSCGGGGGGGGGGNTTPQNADISGEWTVSEQWASTSCVNEGTDQYTLTMQQNGTGISGTDQFGNSYQGSVSGSTATFTSTWTSQSGTVNETWNPTRQSDGTWTGTCQRVYTEIPCTVNVQETLTESSSYSDASWTDYSDASWTDYSDTSWTDYSDTSWTDYSDTSWTDYSDTSWTDYSDVSWHHLYSDWSNAWGNWMQSY